MRTRALSGTTPGGGANHVPGDPSETFCACPRQLKLWNTRENSSRTYGDDAGERQRYGSSGAEAEHDPSAAQVMLWESREEQLKDRW